MSPDDPPPSVALDNLSDDPLTAEEQAAFDSMRDGGEVTPPPEVPEARQQEQQATPEQQQQQKEAPPAPSDDDDIEVAAPVTGTKQKRVSIHKYERLVERAKAAEERAEQVAKERQELLERTARADERLKIISEAMATPQAEEQPVDEDPQPDPEKDIFGAFQWAQRQIVKLSEKLNGIETGAREATSDNDLASTYQRDAASFAAKEPTFADAYVYLIKQRDAELQLAGVTDQRAREAQIVREEKGLVRAAIEQRRSPAEMIYSMAKGRGFTPQQRQAAAEQQQQQQKDPKALDATLNGGKEPPAQQQAKPSVTAEIEAIKRGQEAAQSLSNVGGGAQVRELTSQVLADMPEEEFNDLIQRLPREKVMELMGN